MLKGAEYFLEKPFSSKDIKNVIQSISIIDTDEKADN
jgi:FixJ family two-component response regulator